MKARLLGVTLFIAACGPVAAVEPVVTVANCLQNGYDVKAAFSDNNGGAYIILQKGTSAYMCHSNTAPRCEKLN